MDYPFNLGRFKRDLNGVKLFQGVVVSTLLQQVEAHKFGVFHFPEVGAVEFTSNAARASGVLFRECLPFHAKFDEYIPFCSLFGKNTFSESARPLIAELATRRGGVEWIAQAVVLPLLRSFWTLVFDFGLWPEPHAQNLVLGLRTHGRSEVIWRDCQGFVGEPTLDESVRDHMQRVLVGQEGVRRRSYLYDSMLGGYVLDPLLAAAEDAFPGARCRLQEVIVSESRGFLKRNRGNVLFPTTGAYEMSRRSPDGRYIPFTLTETVKYR